MVLIITASFDQSSNDVIDCLERFGYPYCRLNMDTIYAKRVDINYDLSDLTCKKQIFYGIDLSQIKAIWYRKNVNIDYLKTITRAGIDEDMAKSINTFLMQELNIFKHYVFESFKGRILGHRDFKDLNKLKVLEMARKSGLNTPKTFITNSKSGLSAFMNEVEKVSTKPISEAPRNIKDSEGNFYLTYNSIVDQDMLDELPSYFYPSLFQQYIEKQFEIRTFFIKDRFYSMAIFSQNTDTTKIDWRVDESLSYRERFKLPKEVETKLRKLCQMMQINCGTIDLIMSANSRIYFLELNPSGQYGDIQETCKYPLNEEIAKTLYELSQ